MRKMLPVFGSIAALASSHAVAHQADGPLRVLPMGSYECSMPGNAAGKAWIPVKNGTFKIASASRYVSDKGAGTYLLAGNSLVFTRGPMKGMRFIRTNSAVLYQIDKNGERTKMRCSQSSRR